jgi:uncharacterized protein YecE (DUF72 family)
VDTLNDIRCGVAGWTYPDWDGFVYPRGTSDKLRYVAGFVDVVEINTTFYRPPERRTVQTWAVRTADLPDFRFTAKIHQDVTHRGRLDTTLAAVYRHGLEPLTSTGRLTHLLSQFRYDYADSPENRAYLRRIKNAFDGIAHNLTLELRHISWQAPVALDYLASLNVTVANLDYPLADNSFNLPHCTVGQHAYFRVHGRNYAAWFSKDADRNDTYNYLYSRPELDEMQQRIVAISKMTRSLTFIANNHYQGKEMATALQMKSMLGGQCVAVPPLLASAYPELKTIAKPPATPVGEFTLA